MDLEFFVEAIIIELVRMQMKIHNQKHTDAIMHELDDITTCCKQSDCKRVARMFSQFQEYKKQQEQARVDAERARLDADFEIYEEQIPPC